MHSLLSNSHSEYLSWVPLQNPQETLQSKLQSCPTQEEGEQSCPITLPSQGLRSSPEPLYPCLTFTLAEGAPRGQAEADGRG